MTRNAPTIRALALLTAAIAVPALAGELEWLGEIPGVGTRVEKSSAGAKELVYVLTGDEGEAFAAVREGFAKRGFDVKKAADVSAGGATSRSFTATKDGRVAKVNVSSAAGVSTLSVSFRGSGGSAADFDFSGSSGGSGKQVGSALVVNDDGVTETYRCRGTAVTINGNDGHLTFEGAVSAITVNGNDNTLVVKATLTAMTVLGNGNAIKVSRSANPSKPVTTVLGSRNTIERID